MCNVCLAVYDCIPIVGYWRCSIRSEQKLGTLCLLSEILFSQFVECHFITVIRTKDVCVRVSELDITGAQDFTCDLMYFILPVYDPCC